MNIKIEIHTDKDKISDQTMQRLMNTVDKVADDLFDGRVYNIDTVKDVKIRYFKDLKEGFDDK